MKLRRGPADTVGPLCFREPTGTFQQVPDAPFGLAPLTATNETQ